MVDRFKGEFDGLLGIFFETGLAGRMVCDPDGRIVRVNAALAGMVGANVDLSVGAPASGVIAKETRTHAWKQIFPVLTGQAPPKTIVSLLEGDGAPVVEILPMRLLERDGTISGLILRFADISVQRHLEAQLTQGQKLQAVGQLAGGIAHDFNNLLTAVMGAADDIAARPGTDPTTLEDAVQIRASAERGADLVRQLLAFGRQQTLQPRVVAINEAITQISILLRRLLGSKIRLELDLETPGRKVMVDPVQLDQVLVNLAVNARDAMLEGESTPNDRVLTLRSGHLLLLHPLVRGQETIPPGRYVVIEVEDTGAGIPPAALPRIFDPFFTTRRDRGGNGLGLSTVHGIVRQSEGFLAVESDLGKGTRFRIYLPRYEGETTPQPAPAIAPAAPKAVATAPPTGQRTVLIVEDEEDVRRLAVRQFTRRGWRVLSAEDGDAACELLAADDPALDLIVSDVVMPGLDGPSLVRLLREQRPNLPAILVSGYADEALRRDLANQDIVFMPKPYSLRALIDVAETVLQRSVDLVPS